MRKAILTLGAAVVAAAAVAIPAAASASTSTVTPIVAKTYSPLHADTTSVSGSATQALPNGIGWSYDDMHLIVSAKPEAAPGNWNVTLKVASGSSYHGFADPRMATRIIRPWRHPGQPGNVTGFIRYDIQSPPRRTRRPSRP